MSKIFWSGRPWFRRYTFYQPTFLVVRYLAIYIHVFNYFKPVVFYFFPHCFKKVVTDTICTRNFVGLPFPHSAPQFVQCYRCVQSVRRVLRELFYYTSHQASKTVIVHWNGVKFRLHVFLKGVHYVFHRCVGEAVTVFYCLGCYCYLPLPFSN